MFKQFYKTEPKKSTKKYIFKVGDRVRYIGQIMSDHHYDVRKIHGTVNHIDITHKVTVEWDNDTCSEEDVDDLELARIDSVSTLVSELQERRRRWPEQSHAAANYVVSHEDAIKMHINLSAKLYSNSAPIKIHP